MIRDALGSAWWVLREPRILGLSAASTLLFSLLLHWLGASGDLSALPAGAITGTILVLLARSWVGLVIAATALGVLRRDRTAPFLRTVSVSAAIAAFILTALPIGPLIIGAFLMVSGRAVIGGVGVVIFVVGVVWVAIWSQAGMLLVDGKAELLEAADSSRFMTRGYRGEIMALWLIVSIALVAAARCQGWLDRVADAWVMGPPTAVLIGVVLQIAADAFATCCYAALYYELDRSEMPQ